MLDRGFTVLISLFFFFNWGHFAFAQSSTDDICRKVGNPEHRYFCLKGEPPPQGFANWQDYVTTKLREFNKFYEDERRREAEYEQRQRAQKAQLEQIEREKLTQQKSVNEQNRQRQVQRQKPAQAQRQYEQQNPPQSSGFGFGSFLLLIILVPK